MKNNDISIGSLGKALNDFVNKLGKYAFLLFFIFLAAIYGFVLYRINELGNAEPSEAAISQAANKTPHIDEHVVTQLKNLQDNSVSVKTLFDEARDNPFNE